MIYNDKYTIMINNDKDNNKYPYTYISVYHIYHKYPYTYISLYIDIMI